MISYRLRHTVFGRVTSGMEVCQAIENSRCNRFDKPFEDIKIINIEIISGGGV